MTTAAAPSPPAERYERLPLELVVPSKTNPRTHFDGAKLDELAGSIADKGVIQPILVRPFGKNGSGRFEIIAGECRFRASTIAKQTHIPAVIRDYSDEQVLELQLIENIHRRDLTPLEQATGYRKLIAANPTKHSAESIAARIGMSPQWVWDRMKLNDLIPEAKQLLERDKMTVGHAILIARQKPDNQKRIIDPHNDALFEALQHGLEFDGRPDPQEKPGKYDDVKAVSVRELEAWIARHIRFDVEHAAKAVPLQFETTAARVQEAAAQPGRGKKVVSITFDHMPADDARDPHERTYGIKSWRRADGTKKTQPTGYYGDKFVDSPTCDHSVLGVVAVGDDHYGETFLVCVARDRCRVHWGKEIAEREKNAKARQSGKPGAAARQLEAQRKRDERERTQREARERRWKEFRPALTKAVYAALDEQPAVLPKAIFAKLVHEQGLPASTTPAQLSKALLRQSLDHTFRQAWYGAEPDMVKWAHVLKVDVKACEPKPLLTAGESSTKKTTGKAAKKAKGKS